MISPTHCWSPHTLILILHLFLFISAITATNLPEKLDQTSVPLPQEAADTEIKCGTCPCVNPCAQQLPPPPPPPPPPAAPKFNPATTYCTPAAPPPPRFIYVTGVPAAGDLYVADPYNTWVYYSGAGRPNVIVGLWLLLVGCGVLEMMVIGRL
ncbi:hypothetical protein FH972_007840 [Carpinus fangiana]|uniref:4Fe-4S ferredoxin-type domain-containing protein n=1 Tax=Carpinus fangiana TaxID=176857 RepID=A0A5N6QWV0_9ROSI|nr:hypothetical protein FH972_007840 [Carpinus fangiana]